MTLTGAILAAAGTTLLAIGAFLFFRTRSFLEEAVSAQGKVIGFEESYSSDTGRPMPAAKLSPPARV